MEALKEVVEKANLEGTLIDCKFSPDPSTVLPLCITTTSLPCDDDSLNLYADQLEESKEYYIECAPKGFDLYEHIGKDIEVWGEIYTLPEGINVLRVEDFMVLNDIEKTPAITFKPKNEWGIFSKKRPRYCAA